MIDKYKDELLQSFLDNYCRIYLIDLEEDSIVKISEKPVTSRISMMLSLTWMSFMLPWRFMVFCALSSTRSPAEEM